MITEPTSLVQTLQDEMKMQATNMAVNESWNSITLRLKIVKYSACDNNNQTNTIIQNGGKQLKLIGEYQLVTHFQAPYYTN